MEVVVIPYLDLGDLKWDKGLLLSVLGGKVAAGGQTYAAGGGIRDLATADGCVLVVPCGTAPTDYSLEAVQGLIDGLRWAVVLLTSDEGSTFPWRELHHPNMHLWIQTPRPEVHRGHDRFLLHGTPPWTSGHFHGPMPEKTCSWAFAGQINHHRREQMAKRLRRRIDGVLLESSGFTQGFPRDEYLDLLAMTKMAPCPSGPLTPDSFRVWESIEAGCVPLVDQLCPAYDEEYWPFVLGRQPPFPTIYSWRHNLDDAIDHQLSLWPRTANRISAWWQRYKRDLYWRIDDDVTEVSGVTRDFSTGQSSTTVLIPTSPIASHPSTAIIEETVASVRFWHPTAEIIVMCDGIRDAQAAYEPAYEDYLNRLMWLCAHQWTHVVPLIFDSHHHQAAMTREALKMVRTPTILFVEHDTPLVTDCPIDWARATALVVGGELNVLRLHHEALILQPHKHLMVDHETIDMDGLPVRRTRQWSQRPHLASTDYYRRLLADPRMETAGMIEDRAHGVVEAEAWGANRVAIYHPDTGNIKRSLNLDGRGDDPKWAEL